MNNCKSKLDLSSLLLSFYTSVVWALYIFINFTKNFRFILILSPFIFAAAYAVFYPLTKWLRKMQPDNETYSKKNKLSVFIISALVSFAVMMVWFQVYAPGCFVTDPLRQYGQAVTGNYNDWHPVWHTFLFYTIPLKLTNNVNSIVFLQLIYFALTMGYMSLTISELWNIKAGVISLIYILFNPFVCFTMLYPYKDIAFALAALNCFIISVRLIYRENQTSKTWKLILFAFLLASATIFRHNAVLFTFPLLIALFLQIEKKTSVKIIVFTLIAVFIIKVPVYSMLEVEKPDSRVEETMGLPLTVIGNVAKCVPEISDKELSEFAYTIAPKEKWQSDYYCGSYNSIKWTGIDNSVIEKTGQLGILKLTLKSFYLYPIESFEGLIKLTDMVYGFEDGLDGNQRSFLPPNDYGIVYPENRNMNLVNLLETYSDFIDNSIFVYLRTYGVVLLAILTAALSQLNFTSWASWKKIFMAVPIFAYDFGTMLLLSGPDSRFFFITFLVAPLTIVFLMTNREEKKYE